MPESKRPLKVFLCHAHADRDPVRGLYTRLTQDGVDAWLDKAKLLPGQDWELEIRKAVREADVVVVCLSKQFNQAGFRQKEVRLALDTAMEKPEGEIFIIPARLEECDNLESLRRWHWVDLFEDEGYEMLMRALRARANKIGATLQIKKPSPPIEKPVINETDQLPKAISKGTIVVLSLVALVVTMTVISYLIKQVQTVRFTDNPMVMIETFAAQTSVAQTQQELNPMALIATFAAQTSVAQTQQELNPMVIFETFAAQTSVVQTQQADNLMSLIETFASQTAVAKTAIAQARLITTPVPPDVRPVTYTLQEGEFPHCVARRYNVDPDQMLSMSGSPSLYYAGLTLNIPQSGVFPGVRALLNHPAFYDVFSEGETVYSVACKYGDVLPQDIATLNGLSINSPLYLGQRISIP